MVWLEEQLAKADEIQTQTLGMGKGDQHEGQVLNRFIRCTEAGWEVEADPRHAELVVEQLGIEGKVSALPAFQALMRKIMKMMSHWKGGTSPGTGQLGPAVITWLLTGQIVFLL